MKHFVHEKAVVEGSVELGENVSVWAGAVIRGDEGTIKIGNNSNIQDNCVVHGSAVVGENVTVGHAAVVHGCKIGSNVIIGMNATILSGAVVGEWCIIAAGSVVRENQKIPPNSLVAGVPAKVKRSLADSDRERITEAWRAYAERTKLLP